MNTLPYAKPIGVYEAKTHFSKIVDDLVNGRCGPVPVLRHGVDGLLVKEGVILQSVQLFVGFLSSLKVFLGVGPPRLPDGGHILIRHRFHKIQHTSQ